MFMALQASKAALCAIVLLLSVLLALSGVMLGGTLLAGQSPWDSDVQADAKRRQPCAIRGGGPSSTGQASAMPEPERPAPNSSSIQKNHTHQGETPC
ncbi:hypothetical protein D3C85_1156280 [compost metagenome]